MARRRYVVGYDIRDDRRLRKVYKTMRGYGDPLQYSVFICDLTRAEKATMCLQLGTIIKHTVDSIAIVDLGPATDADLHFQFLGTHRPLPDGRPRVY